MAGDAPNVINDTAGVAAAAFGFTNRHKRIEITNLHATQQLVVRVFSGTTAAAAKAKAVATPAVIGADDNYTINANARPLVIARTPKRTYFAISVIASGASTPFTCSGEDWVAD